MTRTLRIVLAAVLLTGAAAYAEPGAARNPFLGVKADQRKEKPLPPMPAPAPLPPPMPPPMVEGPARVSTWKILGRAGNSVVVTDSLSSSTSTASLVYSVPNGGIWDNCVVDYPVLDCTSSRVTEVKQTAKAVKQERQMLARHKEKAEENSKKSGGPAQAATDKSVAVMPPVLPLQPAAPAWFRDGTDPKKFREPALGEVDVVVVKPGPDGMVGIRAPKEKREAISKLLGTAITATDVMGAFVYVLANGSFGGGVK